MAATRTYKMQALVLRKTKLGERDLIITLLSDSGELVKAVAKGARKPGSSFAAKLDLFSSVDLMLAKGRSLDVVTDARFTSATPRLSFGLETGACAAAVAELLSTVCQEGLDHPRLYEMAKAAFQAIAAQDAVHAIALADAALIKIVSSAGFRPNLHRFVRGWIFDVLQRRGRGSSLPFMCEAARGSAHRVRHARLDAFSAALHVRPGV